MRPRFRLRTLFVLTALVAAACWWFVGPTLTAERFIAANERGDSATIERLWTESRGPQSGFEYLAMFKKRPSLRERGLKCQLAPLTWQDLCRGIRHIDIDYAFLVETIDTYEVTTIFPALIATHWDVYPDPLYGWQKVEAGSPDPNFGREIELSEFSR